MNRRLAARAVQCGRQCLPSAICATRSKGPRGPAVGYGPHRTIYLPGIDANGKVAARQAVQASELTAQCRARVGHSDCTLRASELCDLQWSQVELATGRLHVRRAKNGSPSVHPMQGDEIRAVRRLQREQGPSSHVFMTERDGPMTPKAFHALFGRIGARAKMQFPVHPHMLRHGCGYALANAGHDTRALQAWLGHKNIQHTVRYTELAPERFKNFWRA